MNYIAGLALVIGLIFPVTEARAAWYVGGGPGYTNSSASNSEHFQDNSCDTAVTCTTDKHDTAFRLFGGYAFGRHFGVELGYTDLGTVADFDDSNATINLKTSQDTKGFDLSFVGRLQIAQSPVDLFVRAGVYRWQSESSRDRTPVGGFPHVTNKANGADPLFGLGAEYRFVGNWNVRFEWTRYFNLGKDPYLVNSVSGDLGTVDVDLDVLSLTLGYSF